MYTLIFHASMHHNEHNGPRRTQRFPCGTSASLWLSV